MFVVEPLPEGSIARGGEIGRLGTVAVGVIRVDDVVAQAVGDARKAAVSCFIIVGDALTF